MRIDVNSYIGHWPFRQIRHNTAAGLLKLMDKYQIDKACVTNINGIFYKNSHNGNRELYAEIKPHRDRLIPFCIINPFYIGWQEDFKESIEKIGAGAIVLYPALHNYNLKDECARELVQLCGQSKIPVVLTQRLMDERQEHWLYKMVHTAVDDICECINRNENTQFIIRDVIIPDFMGKLNGANFYFDTSRINLTIDKELIAYLSSISDRLLFGSQIPLKTPLPALLKNEQLDLSDAIKEKINSGNIVRLLGDCIKW